MCETGSVEVLETLNCPVQLLSHLVKGAAGKPMLRTNPSLLTWCFLM
jgi:hypothetical protein